MHGSVDRRDQLLHRLSALTSDFAYSAEVRPDGTIHSQWLSESFERLFGLSYAEIVEIGWRRFVHPADQELTRERLEALLAGGSFDGIFRLLQADGSVLSLFDRARSVVDGDGRVIEIYGAATDITERLRSEERLRESEQKYRRLVESSPMPIVVHCEARIVFVNDAAVHALGGERAADLLHRRVLELVHPEDRSDAAQRIRAVYRGEHDGQPVEERLLRLDGEVLEALVVGKTIDYQGRPGGEVTFQDVTERNRVQRQRRMLEERDQHARKLESLGSLAAGIAHDFNNLLVGVLGHTDLALDMLDEPTPVREHLEELGRAAQQAADLAQQLLDYAGEARGRAESLDLSSLVAEMEKLLRISVRKRADVSCWLGSDLPPVVGDRGQLRQVVMNLLLNAADAMVDVAAGDVGSGSRERSRGRIEVRTRAEADAARSFTEDFLVDARAPRVVLEVTDDGCGMDAETLRRLFDPFFTTKPTGRGLGMATVLGLVRAHRGALAVRSTLGEGTTVEVALPAASGDG
ncbi:MAG: PAS domain S-box protein [Acidobacteriota bacterium]